MYYVVETVVHSGRWVVLRRGFHVFPAVPGVVDHRESGMFFLWRVVNRCHGVSSSKPRHLKSKKEGQLLEL